MADKRIEELTAKMRSGTSTPAEIEELKALLSQPRSMTDTFVDNAVNASQDQIKQGMQAQAKKELAAAGPAMSDKPTEQQLTGREPFKNKTTIDPLTRGKMEQIASGDYSPITDPAKVAQYQKDIEEARLPKETPAADVAPVSPIVSSAPASTPSVSHETLTTSSGVEVPKDEAVAAIASEDTEKPTFGQKLKKLATTYGVPILEILQAVGYQRAGINKPTMLEMQYQAQLDKQEKDYMDRLEQRKLEAQKKAQSDAIKQQQDFEAGQNELNRIAEKEATGQKISADERLLAMQLAAQRQNAKFTKKPLIPE